MKHLFGALLLLVSSTGAWANCYGSSSYYSCTYSSGNDSVSKYGNTTTVNGYNPQTGSNWSQNSQRLGNTTYINGQTNGRAWNETVQSYPGMTTYSGSNSRGQGYTKTCTAYGCY